MVETDTGELLKVFSIEKSKILYKHKTKIQNMQKDTDGGGRRQANNEENSLEHKRQGG